MPPPRDETDPVLRHARREAVVIGLSWVASTAYCCTYCYLFGYRRPGRPLGPGDIHPVLGVPSWVVWGVLVPWVVCALFTFWFAGFFMADDDLGRDRAPGPETEAGAGGAGAEGGADG